MYKATIALAVLAGALVLVSAIHLACTPTFYEQLGFTKEEATTQAALDREQAQQFLQATRDTFWPIMHTILTGGAALITAILGRYLYKESKDANTLAPVVKHKGTPETMVMLDAIARAKGNSVSLSKKIADA